MIAAVQHLSERDVSSRLPGWRMIEGRATRGMATSVRVLSVLIPLPRHRGGPLVASSTAPGRPAALHSGVRVRSTVLDVGPGMEQPCAGHRSGTSRRRQHLLPGPGRTLLRADRLRRSGSVRARVSAVGSPHRRHQHHLPRRHRFDGLPAASRRVRSHLAGMVAASTLLANTWLTRTFVPTTPPLAVLPYWPLIIVAAAAPAASFGATVTLWALALAQSLTDVVYVAPALLGPLALLGVVRLSRRASRRTGMSLLLAVLLAAASLLPVYRAHWRVAAKNPLLSQQTVWRQDPEGTVLPSDLVSPFRPFVIPPLAVLLLGAGAIALRRQGGPRDDPERRAWRAGLFWTAAGGLLSLGPYVEVGGLGRLPTPQAMLGGLLPSLGRARVPSRFGVAGVFGLAILCGLAFATVARAIDRRLGGGTLARGISVMLAGRASGEWWATLAASRPTCCRKSCPRRSSRRRRSCARWSRTAGRSSRSRSAPSPPSRTRLLKRSRCSIRSGAGSRCSTATRATTLADSSRG